MEILTTQTKHAQLLADYYCKNAERFAPWRPQVRVDRNSIGSWIKRLQERTRGFKEGRAVHFMGLEDGRLEKVIGTCSLTNIIYCPSFFTMGYSVDAEYEGKFYMRRIAIHIIDYAFNNIGLNRICANCMSANTRPAQFLEKLGFK